MNKKLLSWVLVIGFAVPIPILLINLPIPIQIADNEGVYNTDVPISVQFKKVSSSTSGSVNDIVISGKYAVIAEGSSGIRVLDISNIDSITDVDTLGSVGIAVSVLLDGTILYVGTSNNGLRIVNFTDPSDLAELGSINSISNHLKIAIAGGFAYSAADNDGLRITNISNPALPVEVADLSIASAKSLAITGDYLFIAAGVGGVKVVNITNPLSPNLVKTIATTNAKDVLIDGSRLFIADASGLICVNINSPLNPIILNTLATDNPSGYNGISLFGVFLYATGSDKTEVFALENWPSPTREPYSLPGGETIQLNGFHAYFAQKTAGLTIAEVAKSFTPSNSYIPAYHYKLSGTPYDLDVRGDLAFISTKRMGLRIWNLSTLDYTTSSWSYTPQESQGEEDPYASVDVGNEFKITLNNATELGHWKGPYDQYDLQFDGSLAYITSRGFGLRIVNFSNVKDPQEIGSFRIDPVDAQANNSFSIIRIAGDLAVIGTGPENHIPEVFTVNITDPTNPILLDRYSLPITDWDPYILKNHVVDIEIDGNLLYVLSHGQFFGDIVENLNRFTILDISDPSSIVQLGEITSPGTPTALTLFGHYAYYSFSYFNSSMEPGGGYTDYILRIVDIQNPLSPIILNNMSSGPEIYNYAMNEPVAKDLIIEGNRLYAGMRWYINVYDISDPTAPTEIQKIKAYKAGNIVIRGNWLYYTPTDAYELTPADGEFCSVKIKDGTSLDVDGDGLSYFQETYLETSSTNLDSDGDEISDNVEFRYGFNPNVKDSDQDADSDGISNIEELKLGTNPTMPDTDGDNSIDSVDPDPLNNAIFPSNSNYYILIAVAVVCAISLLFSLIFMKKSYRKDVEIKAYLCHAPEDAERYKIPEINSEIAKNPQILPADKIEEGVQVFIYFATATTLNNPEWKELLALARKRNLFVVPIKTESIEWPDMAKLELNRDLGVEYKSENFEGVIADIVKFLKNYQIDFTKLRNALEKSSTSFVSLLTFKVDVSEEQILKIIPHLIANGVVSGIFTSDKKQFLSVKEAQKRINTIGKAVKNQDLSHLAYIVGLDPEGIPKLLENLQNQTNVKDQANINKGAAN